MGEEKRPFSLRIDVDLLKALERQAKREGRPTANLGDVLLRWAYRQMEIAGNSVTLQSWHARPGNIELLLDRREITGEQRDQFQRALNITLNDAPSEVLNHLIATVTEWAIKYGKAGPSPLVGSMPGEGETGARAGTPFAPTKTRGAR